MTLNLSAIVKFCHFDFSCFRLYISDLFHFCLLTNVSTLDLKTANAHNICSSSGCLYLWGFPSGCLRSRWLSCQKWRFSVKYNSAVLAFGITTLKFKKMLFFKATFRFFSFFFTVWFLPKRWKWWVIIQFQMGVETMRKNVNENKMQWLAKPRFLLK